MAWRQIPEMDEAEEKIMSSPREKILGRVNAALAPLSTRAGYPEYADNAATMPALQTGGDLWSVFKNRLQLVNGVALDSAAELVAWLRENKHTQGYCDPDIWSRLAFAFDDTIRIERVFDRTQIDEYAFGITRAAGAIAETGSIILKDTTTSTRLGALAPWVHIALVPREFIYPDIASAVAALGDDPNVIWCTGPSKTADVEGILIQGVHGPGVQIALLATSSSSPF
jgi:L-lactate dehydrogenase complex protein LldG